MVPPIEEHEPELKRESIIDNKKETHTTAFIYQKTENVLSTDLNFYFLLFSFFFGCSRREIRRKKLNKRESRKERERERESRGEIRDDREEKKNGVGCEFISNVFTNTRRIT